MTALSPKHRMAVPVWAWPLAAAAAILAVRTLQNPDTRVLGLLLAGGLLFFAAGSIGLLRFPDTLSRLHALTKADTLGFGLVVAGLALRAGSLLEVAQMLLIWLLVLASGATACQLLARQREDQGADGERDDD